MMNKISIPGLNNLQSALADLLWTTDDPDLVKSHVLQQIELVKELILAATIDSIIDDQK